MISTNMHKLYDNIKLQRSQELNPQVSELHGKLSGAALVYRSAYTPARL